MTLAGLGLMGLVARRRKMLGGVVSSGNMSNFLSGVVNMNAPYGRDNLVATAVIAAAVPEPETCAMLLSGFGLLG